MVSELRVTYIMDGQTGRRKKPPVKPIPAVTDRIQCLAEKTVELAAKDTKMATFGASTYGNGNHCRMNPPLPTAELVL